MKTILSWSTMLAVTAAGFSGCGTPDAAIVDAGSTSGSTIVIDTPVLLDAMAPACSQQHTVCMTVKMPDSIPGPPTHLAVGYFRSVPVNSPPGAYGVIKSPSLVAGQQFRLEAKDGGLIGDFHPVVSVFMPGGGDIVPIDKLDYTAEAPQAYQFTGAPLNLPDVMNLAYGF